MDLADAARQIRGAFRLGQRDPGGLADLDSSREGFWRSFRAALLVLPGYALMIFLEPVSFGQVQATDPVAAILVDLIAYVIFWTSMPVLMPYLCRAFGREKHYTTYVVADNWAQIPQAYLMALVSLIGYADVLPDTVQAVLGMAAILWIMLFKFWVARIALSVTAGPALAVILTDVTIGVVVSSFATRLGG